MSKYVRVPFTEADDAQKIKDELSPSEMANALIKAYNESVEGDTPEDPESIDSYDSEREIEEAREKGVISPRKAEQLKLKARRSGNSVGR